MPVLSYFLKNHVPILVEQRFRDDRNINVFGYSFFKSLLRLQAESKATRSDYDNLIRMKLKAICDPSPQLKVRFRINRDGIACRDVFANYIDEIQINNVTLK